MRHRVTLYTLWFLTKEITSEIGRHGGGSDEVHFQSLSLRIFLYEMSSTRKTEAQSEDEMRE